jgi:hypothetical protein
LQTLKCLLKEDVPFAFVSAFMIHTSHEWSAGSRRSTAQRKGRYAAGAEALRPCDCIPFLTQRLWALPLSFNACLILFLEFFVVVKSAWIGFPGLHSVAFSLCKQAAISSCSVSWWEKQLLSWIENLKSLGFQN